MKRMPQPYSWDAYRVKESYCLAQRLEEIYPIQPFGNWLTCDTNKTFWQNFPSRTETQPREKTWNRKITSERQALRETARLWRYVARTGGEKPETNWGANCPLCEFFDCVKCPLNNFWGSLVGIHTKQEVFNYGLLLCLESAASSFQKWSSVWRSPKKRHYYALRIRWAALRVLNDHFSS